MSSMKRRRVFITIHHCKRISDFGCRTSGALSQRPALATFTKTPKSDIRNPKSLYNAISALHLDDLEYPCHSLHPPSLVSQDSSNGSGSRVANPRVGTPRSGARRGHSLPAGSRDRGFQRTEGGYGGTGL